MSHNEVPIYVSGWVCEYDWSEPRYTVWEEDHEIWIDEKLAPLIEVCWKAGIVTAGSCQGGPGGGPGSTGDETLIVFPRRRGMRQFRRLVGNGRPDWRWVDEPGEPRAVWFPYQQLAAVTKAARAFSPFYGQPLKPPKPPIPEVAGAPALAYVPLPMDEWFAKAEDDDSLAARRSAMSALERVLDLLEDVGVDRCLAEVVLLEIPDHVEIGAVWTEDERKLHIVYSGTEVLGSFSSRSLALLFLNLLHELRETVAA